MRIFDCFQFFNEVELLELRLMELYDTVDYFVIAEANKTHTNTPKPFNFEDNADRYKPWMDKIIYVKVTDLPDSSPENAWVSENFQRNALSRGIEGLATKGDKILVSDADEIPSRQAIEGNRDNPNWIVFKQSLWYYYVNCRASRNWGGTIMSLYGDYHSLQSLRNSCKRHSFGVYHGGGWHYSSLYGDSAERLIYKTSSIADYYTGYTVGDADTISEKARTQQDLYGRTSRFCKMKIVDISNDKPVMLDKWLEKYPQFFWRES